MRILLIEDDEMVGVDLAKAIGDAGYSVDWVQDGIAGQIALADDNYVAVLLDLGLPRRSGLEVLRTARTRGNRTPILVLTARDSLDDRVAGLDVGADDYIVKPFQTRELLARLRAAIRRRDGHAQSLLGTEALQIDLSTREASCRGVRQSLSAREFALLHALLEQPGAILSREQLEQRIYGWNEVVCSNTVEVIIHGLRKRLGADIIRNVRGLGWRVPKVGE
ncbi:DNA-binding response regulator [Dyella lipolytica]|uniref:Response regulator transcription factor n=1 Tax=Dyella lipolytica TaxID=1867835 RepID=A0ABW8IX13_9GAMM|nr:response regulator transcription factor [Dyella lipolytica]GLQ48445.1 DNA-binding response regulator [Dyella lipolytica]